MVCAYLQWAWSVWLFPAQVQLTQDGQTNKEPVAEAVVVDEPKDVLHTQIHQSHGTLLDSTIHHKAVTQMHMDSQVPCL